jgi:hypothetical protein
MARSTRLYRPAPHPPFRKYNRHLDNRERDQIHDPPQFRPCDAIWSRKLDPQQQASKDQKYPPGKCLLFQALQVPCCFLSLCFWKARCLTIFVLVKTYRADVVQGDGKRRPGDDERSEDVDNFGPDIDDAGDAGDGGGA